MAPRAGLTQTQKQEKVLQYFRQSRTCHTLKELEKALPTAASINQMTVKDIIKELTDENKVKVEKIGSGNWYWCWAGEEAKECKTIITQLESEIAKVDASNTELQREVTKLKEDQAAAHTDTAHQSLLSELGTLEEEVKTLTIETVGWENAVAGGIAGLIEASSNMKGEISTLTDDIDILEGYLLKLAAGDKEFLESIRRECYGAAYVEGEGLAEIEGLNE